MSNLTRLTITTLLALGLAAVLAMTLALAVAPDAVLAEDHPNGDVISPTQTMVARARVERDRPGAAVANVPHLGRPVRPDRLRR